MTPPIARSEAKNGCVNLARIAFLALLAGTSISACGRGDPTAADAVTETCIPSTGALDCEGVSLSGSEFRFEGASLASGDFDRADLRGVGLKGTTLSGGSFRGANLAGADLRDSQAVGTDFSGANLVGADLSGSDFTGAVLSGANLSAATLADVVLRDVVALDSNFSATSFSNSTFSGVATRSNFRNSHFSFVNLNLRADESNFEGARLEGVTISGSQLSLISSWDGAILENVAGDYCDVPNGFGTCSSPATTSTTTTSTTVYESSGGRGPSRDDSGSNTGQGRPGGDLKIVSYFEECSSTGLSSDFSGPTSRITRYGLLENGGQTILDTYTFQGYCP